MDPDQQREIASKGGHAAQESGQAHELTEEERLVPFGKVSRSRFLNPIFLADPAADRARKSNEVSTLCQARGPGRKGREGYSIVITRLSLPHNDSSSEA